MVAGIAFLSKKSFNPANLSNQKAVWEAQKQKENDKKKVREREEQLRRERDDEELARARDGARGGNQASLRFMYAPPPGMAASVKKEEVDDSDHAGDSNQSASPNITQRQPGDDDAAAAFRQMLAAAKTEETLVDGDGNRPGGDSDSVAFSNSSGAALTGTTVDRNFPQSKDHLSALEKAVGRKGDAAGLTLDEQIARFPQLKNAPMARGMTATNVNVSFKPLGTQLRNVQCMACGAWGHSRGDRECSHSGWDPFNSKPMSTLTKTAKDEKFAREVAKVKEERDRGHSSEDDGSSDTDSSYERRRRRRRKKHKSRRRKKESKRRRRSPSYDDEDGRERRHRKSSHKRKRRRRADSEED